VHDDADMDRKVICPMLALWGEKGFMHRMYDVVAVWRERAVNVAGKALPCGHFLAEEAPDETLAELRTFLILDFGHLSR
jgi:haloacetate dehalogenase